jgi:hypothetical protein
MVLQSQPISLALSSVATIPELQQSKIEVLNTLRFAALPTEL